MSSITMPDPDKPRRYFNPAIQTIETAPEPGLLDFHRRLPGYAPTPLVRAPRLAAALGVRQAWVKDESLRLGLPAYKILGASWATYRELDRRFGPFPAWATLENLVGPLRAHLPLTLVAATDGNHGRAVARMARWLGLGAHILVPQDMVPARRAAIEGEGARVEVLAGSYDDAVLAAARRADDTHIIISDTSWEGYTQVPAWVIAGYRTMFEETDAQLSARHEPPPDLVAVQMGVGSLAAAAIQHYRAPGRQTAEHQTRVVGVEPTRADCVLRSLEAGTLTEVSGPHASIMAGLNCGNTSPLAWPLLKGGLSASVAIPDTRAEQAMRLLAEDRVTSGESGAAGAGGLLELLSGADAGATRRALGLTPDSSVLVISTEGATDPGAYARIVRAFG